MLEKGDAEALTLLRSSQEQAVIQATADVRKKYIDEAQETLNGLVKSKEMTTARRDYYAGLGDLKLGEAAYLGLSGIAAILHGTQALTSTGAAVAHVVPDSKI